MNAVEEWRPLPEPFAGLYEVSSHGRVRSLDREVMNKFGVMSRRQGMIISQGVTGNQLGTKKYAHVTLSVGGKVSGHLVHRLVAKAFIPNPDNLPEVNHLDGLKANNFAANLEWASASDNRKHVQGLGLYTGSKPKLTDGDVAEVKRMLSDGVRQHVIADRYKVSRALICLIANGSHR